MTSQELVAIAALGGALYLPVWRNSSLLAGARSVALDARPTAALAFHRARQPRSAHPCAAHNGGCAQLCFPAYEGGAARARCACRHGWRLAGRGACDRVHEDAFLLLARGAPPLVQALALRPRGWEAAAPATDAARPTAADADTRDHYLYYCDVHRYEIVRQRLDGSGREVFAGSDVDNCEGLAVDWMGRNLYWTDAALGTVSAARLDAPGVRRVLVRDADYLHYHPRAITLHPANGCDTYLNRVERLELRSGRRQLVTSDAVKPYGLALYEGQYSANVSLLSMQRSIYILYGPGRIV
ncbi:hypothetical protein HW555_012024 [Spodoptera exigua]|uniref:Uncharacterized protein n=1 Tax=Spodoptera exigua TaxID=7107 RepID=A0A835G7G6_SPOEX|nr:hypothetical protein HW555_012024 [Spodoptera exigua]